MSQENKTTESHAEQLRKKSVEQQAKVIAAFERAGAAGAGESWGKFIQAIGVALVWGISYLPEIAAQLAEANARDREAEIRAKNAEAFVAGIQAEIAKAQGSLISTPAGFEVTKVKR